MNDLMIQLNIEGDCVTWNGERRHVADRLAATSQGLGKRSRVAPAVGPVGLAIRRPAHEDSTY